MKKILFIAIAIVGFSQLSVAQEAAKITPAPSQAERDRDAKTKMNATEGKANPAKTVTSSKQAANYKKAGLTDEQATALTGTMTQFDKKKASINANTKLTADEKNQALAGLEAERTSALQSSMTKEAYQKYTEQNPSAASQAPVKRTTKTAAKKAN